MHGLDTVTEYIFFTLGALQVEKWCKTKWDVFCRTPCSDKHHVAFITLRFLHCVECTLHYSHIIYRIVFITMYFLHCIYRVGFITLDLSYCIAFITLNLIYCIHRISFITIHLSHCNYRIVYIVMHLSLSIYLLSFITLYLSHCIHCITFIALHLSHYIYCFVFIALELTHCIHGLASIATIQGRAKQSCPTYSVITIGKIPHQTTTTTQCVPHLLKAIKYYSMLKTLLCSALDCSNHIYFC